MFEPIGSICGGCVPRRSSAQTTATRSVRTICDSAGRRPSHPGTEEVHCPLEHSLRSAAAPPTRRFELVAELEIGIEVVIERSGDLVVEHDQVDFFVE